MIDVLRVGHATFTTPDLEQQVTYYSDVLGLIVTERDKNRAFLATRTGLEAIALERGDKPEDRSQPHGLRLLLLSSDIRSDGGDRLDR